MSNVGPDTRPHRAVCTDCSFTRVCTGTPWRTPYEQATQAAAGHRTTYPGHDITIEPVEPSVAADGGRDDPLWTAIDALEAVEWPRGGITAAEAAAIQKRLRVAADDDLPEHTEARHGPTAYGQGDEDLMTDGGWTGHHPDDPCPECGSTAVATDFDHGWRCHTCGWTADTPPVTDGGSLQWPSHLERTLPVERTPNRNFEVTLTTAIEDLEAELERLGVDDWHLETALDHQRQNPNYPYANQPEPTDPGVVCRWEMDGERYAVACDAYTRVRDNARAIGLYVREKRKMEARPVTTGRGEFANLQLPSPDDATVADPAPHAVLGVSPDAPPDVIEAAARELKRQYHPDGSDPDREQFKRVVAAETTLLEDQS